MEIGNRGCGGVDVRKKSLPVWIRPPIGRPEMAVREEAFRTFTKDLRRLRRRLMRCRLTELAMESTVTGRRSRVLRQSDSRVSLGDGVSTPAV